MNTSHNNQDEYIEFEVLYPFELNYELNSELSEQEQISNYTSLLSDRERYENLLLKISSQKKLFEELVGLEFKNSEQIFVIRAEKFISTPTPLIIEYQLHPEKMVLVTLKEMIKNTLAKFQIRCIDEVQQEELLCACVLKIAKELDTKLSTKLESFSDFLLSNSQVFLEKKNQEFSIEKVESIEINSNNTLVQIIEDSYSSLY